MSKSKAHEKPPIDPDMTILDGQLRIQTKTGAFSKGALVNRD